METKFDEAFLEIHRSVASIPEFLDYFFGFLQRKTDFFVENEADRRDLGYAASTLEDQVLNIFRKWRNTSKASPKSIEEEPSEESSRVSKRPKPREINQISESYNGAARENYSWSQSIVDLDVLVKVPGSVKISKEDLRIDLGSKHIKLEARSSTLEEAPGRDEPRVTGWTTIFEGRLCFETRKSESVWSFVPGQYVNIHLEKASERWWEALIVGEPKIDLRDIDCSRNYEEMDPEAQMKLQELMWNHRRRLLVRSTLEQSVKPSKK